MIQSPVIAYGYLEHAGLPALGAHVDDSVNYQVYNNIMEKKSSTDAVRQTGGELLLQDGKPITAYYYSTSCGYGTDDRIWKEEGESAAPYLRSVHIAREDSQKNLEQKTNEDTDNKLNDLIQEETLRDYLTAVHEEDYEKEEPWYRWSYTVKDTDNHRNRFAHTRPALSGFLPDRWMASHLAQRHTDILPEAVH